MSTGLPDRPVTSIGSEPRVLRIINADATPEEVAAIVAVFASLGGGDQAPPIRTRSPWSDPGRRLTGMLPASRDAWRLSGLPH